ncbi:hypothetical protein DO97_05140 [Neosynechococcus sphagnicola sy1]|uniref:DUF2949 domain-containing protein n=1 Tax=Neosynechococcus sphagnicola sy1 TaxID=1497020 RepID=A0A098TKA9_9CYAN|nr:DUF2949 domain-containing protein [Neosynechococcus sphagnicola]KGF72734.1 hypothetical protein DO97_05140 [Neosynechococcus sphagnicola sy1]
METSLQTRLICFLEQEMAVPPGAIAIALRQQEVFPSLIPLILWQYGLITLDQLDRVFDWLEAVQV